jgi:branched-chain amino acid transport system ATP-binding protein
VSSSEVILEVKDLEVRYGNIVALRGVSLQVNKGELVAVIGSNGAGKSTMLRTISGLLNPAGGDVLFSGRSIARMPAHKVTALGIAHCPEARRIFGQQSVHDNLLLGGYLRARKDGRKSLDKKIDEIFAIFPILRDRQKQLAGTLSGGEQQMLAIGRALMSSPKLLMLDEPSMGLAPVIIDEVFKVIKRLRDSGEVTVLLVEQLAYRALGVADRAYVLEQGTVRLSGRGTDLLDNPLVQRAYLGAKKEKT